MQSTYYVKFGNVKARVSCVARCSRYGETSRKTCQKEWSICEETDRAAKVTDWLDTRRVQPPVVDNVLSSACECESEHSPPGDDFSCARFDSSPLEIPCNIHSTFNTNIGERTRHCQNCFFKGTFHKSPH